MLHQTILCATVRSARTVRKCDALCVFVLIWAESSTTRTKQVGTKANHHWAPSRYVKHWLTCQQLKCIRNYQLKWKIGRGMNKIENETWHLKYIITLLSVIKQCCTCYRLRIVLSASSFLPGVVPEPPLSTSPVKRRTQSLSALPKDGDKNSPGKVAFTHGDVRIP